MVEGILATAEVKNGNGRYYSKGLWDREMDKYSELIEQRRSILIDTHRQAWDRCPQRCHQQR